MSIANDTLAQVASAAESEVSDRTLLAGIALSSFSALLLELALTRLFSVVLFYHFAFLAISIALLGLGAVRFPGDLNRAARAGRRWGVRSFTQRLAEFEGTAQYSCSMCRGRCDCNSGSA